MTAPRTTAAFELLDANGDSSPVYHFVLRNEVFFSVTLPGTVRGAIGFYSPSDAFDSARFSDTITKLLAKLGPEHTKASWKIVGEAGALKRAVEALRTRRISKTESKPRDIGVGLEVLYLPADGRIRVAPLEQTRTGGLPGKTRVLIVDDSRTIRNLLTRILGQDPGIEVVGSADRPSAALKLIEETKPDVITLDIHMPEMDGVSFLKQYLPRFPVPTVMISSISLEEGPIVLSALESGAVDYMQKPSFDRLKEAAPLIIEKVKSAHGAKVKIESRGSKSAATGNRPLTSSTFQFDSEHYPVIAIGSSTGGTEALRQVFARLPREIPPIVVVQHIPPVFSKAFADRMNSLFPFEVLEGTDGMAVIPNRVIIAPGDTQMTIRKSGNGFSLQIDPNAPPTNRHKPSADVLFNSVSKAAGPRALGVILTGMGSDGAKGLLAMKTSGARTIGQDEETSVVYGMPKAAFDIGAVERQVPLDHVAETLAELLVARKKIA